MRKVNYMRKVCKFDAFCNKMLRKSRIFDFSQPRNAHHYHHWTCQILGFTQHINTLNEPKCIKLCARMVNYSFVVIGHRSWNKTQDFNDRLVAGQWARHLHHFFKTKIMAFSYLQSTQLNYISNNRYRVPPKKGHPRKVLPFSRNIF